MLIKVRRKPSILYCAKCPSQHKKQKRDKTLSREGSFQSLFKLFSSAQESPYLELQGLLLNRSEVALQKKAFAAHIEIDLESAPQGSI